MKVKIKTIKEVEVKYLKVDVGVRYWEDSTVNGQEDANGDLIPFRKDDRWKILIDVETGIIKEWPAGTVADVHYKVCDDGIYKLLDEEASILRWKEGYVPKILDLYKDSYGDYIIMKIDSDGMIRDWNNEASLDDFEEDEE
jgi:hypothetical protein